MDEIWDTMPKKKGLVIFEGEKDLIYLYKVGFVDTQKSSLEEWKKAFSENRQPNGNYKITRESWLAKSDFKCVTAVPPPLNPYHMRPGKWTEEQVERFLKKYLIPSTTFPKKELRKIFDPLKREIPNETYYEINKNFMVMLAQILKIHPSPAHIRSLKVWKLMVNRYKDRVNNLKEARVKRESSQFVREAPREKAAAKKLNALLKR